MSPVTWWVRRRRRATQLPELPGELYVTPGSMCSPTLWFALTDDDRREATDAVEVARQDYIHHRTRMSLICIAASVITAAATLALLPFGGPAMLLAIAAVIALYTFGVRRLPARTPSVEMSSRSGPPLSWTGNWRRCDQAAMEAVVARWLNRPEDMPAILVVDPALHERSVRPWLDAQLSPTSVEIALGLAPSFTDRLDALVLAARACDAGPSPAPPHPNAPGRDSHARA